MPSWNWGSSPRIPWSIAKEILSCVRYRVFTNCIAKQGAHHSLAQTLHIHLLTGSDQLVGAIPNHLKLKPNNLCELQQI